MPRNSSPAWCRCGARFIGSIVLVLALARSGVGAETGVDLLAQVRGYADALLEHGRDTYGSRHSPLIVVCMDLADFRHLDRENPQTVLLNHAGYRPKDAVFRAADPQLDQNFYQILYALTRATGEPRYAREADAILKEFFRVAQSPRTGLFAWGEHLGIGFDDETVQNALWLRGGRWAARFEGKPIHEFFRPWVLWPASFRVEPERCVKFARGLWDYQIHEHSGDFSRHAGWDVPNPDPTTGSHFPRHAGFYIATWAHAYRQTGDEVFARAIRTQLDFYDRIRDPKLQFVPMTGSGEKLSLQKGYEGRSNLSLALDLLNGSELLPAELAARMRAFALRELTLYLKLTSESAVVAGWNAGYGDVSAAGTGAILFSAARVCAEQPLRRALAERALAYARAYLAGDPAEPRWLTPGNLGQAIWLMLDAAQETGDPAFRAGAQRYARYATQHFLNDTPLPRALRGAGFYHAITRGDTLMLALLRLWQEEQAPKPDLSLIYSDR